MGTQTDAEKIVQEVILRMKLVELQEEMESEEPLWTKKNPRKQVSKKPRKRRSDST